MQLFDRNFISRDDPLGSVDIDLSEFARNQRVEQTFPLDGAKSGEVSLVIERAPLSSSELRDVLQVRWMVVVVARQPQTTDEDIISVDFFVFARVAIVYLVRAMSLTKFLPFHCCYCCYVLCVCVCVCVCV